MENFIHKSLKSSLPIPSEILVNSVTLSPSKLLFHYPIIIPIMTTILSLTILLLLLAHIQTSIIGNHDGTQPTYIHPFTYTFVGGSGKVTCKFQLTVDTPFKSILIFAKLVDQPPYPQLRVFKNKNPILHTEMDIENANRGKTQTVQMPSLSPGDTVYLFVAVFDESTAFSFTIQTTQTVSITSLCPTPSKQTLLHQFCTDCTGLTSTGAYCDIQQTQLPQNTLSSDLLPGDYLPFIIPKSTKNIKLSWKSSQPNIQLFIQFKKIATNYAGLVNIFNTNSGCARILVSTANELKSIELDTGNDDVSISVIHKGLIPALVDFTYSIVQDQKKEDGVNVLAIALGVVGGVIVTAVVVYLLVRYIRTPTQPIQPQKDILNNQSIQLKIDTNSNQGIPRNMENKQAQIVPYE